METPKFEDRYCAFLDILGFESLVKILHKDEALHGQVAEALKRVNMLKAWPDRARQKVPTMKVSVFSDTVVVSTQPQELAALLVSVAALVAELLPLGVLLRGGIARGELVHTTDLLYGAGFLEAYELEKRTAHYPRIVVHPQVMESIPSWLQTALLMSDSDNLQFLNPFSMGFGPVDQRGRNPDLSSEERRIFEELELLIVSKIENLPQPGPRAKWEWLKTIHKFAAERLKESGKFQFWTVLSHPQSTPNPPPA